MKKQRKLPIDHLNEIEGLLSELMLDQNVISWIKAKKQSQEAMREADRAKEYANNANEAISANNTTVWWNNKIHVIKDKDMFINLTEGIFFLEDLQTK